MAKIEIRGTAEKLNDIAVFLKNNNIEFSIVDDVYGKCIPIYFFRGSVSHLTPIKLKSHFKGANYPENQI